MTQNSASHRQNPPDNHVVGGKGLASDKLGLWASTVIGLSSTAPLYSLAATLGLVVIAVGVQAPVVFIIAFIPMLLTAFAYRELNNAVPDSGTAFTWASKAFGPRTGWLAGWGVIVAGVIIMANQAQIAAQYLWLVIGDGSIADNRLVVTTTGAVMIALMTWVTYRNVSTGARTQNILIAIQYIAIIGFIVGALLAVFTGRAPDGEAFSFAWFNPFNISAPGDFVQAVLITIFIYWGWDTCLAMSEETKNPRTTPGRAALLSSTLLVITYVLVSIAAIMYAGVGDTGTGLGNPATSGDVFNGLKDAVMGPFGWFIVLAVSVSALATCQTTILPTARGTFAMSVYKALPRRFGTVSEKYQTPSFSTVLMGIVSIVFYVGMTVISDNVLADTVEATSLAVAAYYAITSFAAIRYFRFSLFASWRNFLFRLLLPALGGLMMSGVFVYSMIAMSDPDYGSTTLWGVSGVFITGVVALLVGVVAMFVWSLFPGSKDFFAKRSLNMSTEVKAPE